MRMSQTHGHLAMPLRSLLDPLKVPPVIRAPFARGCFITFGFLGALLMPIEPARAAVQAVLSPTTQTVALGADFDVFVDVADTSAFFNAFDLTVSYNPADVTLLTLSPLSTQLGCLMNGTCSGACSNNFHRFTPSGDSATISVSLLCNAVAVRGPGRAYRLRFRATSAGTRVTTIALRRARFYNAGLSLPGVTTANTTIGIGVSVGVGPGTLPVTPLRVDPNPSSGRVRLTLPVTEGEVDVEVRDLQGRFVRRLGPVLASAQTRVEWDGLDARGIRVPAGLYLVRIAQGGRANTARVVRLQ